MVSSVINVSERTNRLLAILKAKYGLRDKSQAIEKMAQEYEEQILEPAFRPEFVESVKKAEKGKFVKVKSVSQLFK